MKNLISCSRIAVMGLFAMAGAGTVAQGCAETDPLAPEYSNTGNDGSTDQRDGGRSQNDGSPEDAAPPNDADASDAGSDCVPTATRPCVRRIWAGSKATNTCALIDKVSASAVLECWGGANRGGPLRLDAGTTGAGDPIP